MSLLSSTKAAHRTALALNNEAVSLLQQGQFHAAKKISSCSLALLEDLLMSLEAKEPSTTPEGKGEAADKNNNKNESHNELSEPDQHRAMHHHQDNNDKKDEEDQEASRRLLATLEIHVLEDGDFTAMRSAVQYGSSSSVHFPIVLRNDEVERSVVSQHYAIALYNRSLICLLCRQLQRPENTSAAPSSNNKNKEERYLRSARKLLNRSSTLLCSIVAANAAKKNDPSSQEDGSDERIELMLVSALVLNCLALVLRDCQQHRKASVAIKAVQSLSTLLDQDAASQRCKVSSAFAPTYISPAA